MNEDQAEEIIDILYKILDKIEGQKRKEKTSALPAPVETVQTVTAVEAALPLAERPRAQRYPLRVDPGTIFRSRPGYNWVCPYCNKAILAGDMIIAFQPKPDARTTYAHLECDEFERKLWNDLDNG